MRRARLHAGRTAPPAGVWRTAFASSSPTARRNAVSLDMWEALGEIVEAWARNPEVRVIVLRGAGGKAFVSGADISEFEEKRSSPETTEAYRRTAERGTLALQHVDKPTIAMIEGFCVGGGVSVALSCDLRIATASARFAVPAARLGLGYEMPGVRHRDAGTGALGRERTATRPAKRDPHASPLS